MTRGHRIVELMVPHLHWTVVESRGGVSRRCRGLLHGEVAAKASRHRAAAVCQQCCDCLPDVATVVIQGSVQPRETRTPGRGGREGVDADGPIHLAIAVTALHLPDP